MVLGSRALVPRPVVGTGPMLSGILMYIIGWFVSIVHKKSIYLQRVWGLPVGRAFILDPRCQSKSGAKPVAHQASRPRARLGNELGHQAFGDTTKTRERIYPLGRQDILNSFRIHRYGLTSFLGRTQSEGVDERRGTQSVRAARNRRSPPFSSQARRWKSSLAHATAVRQPVRESLQAQARGVEKET
jgi:hypothetical protein